MSSKSGNRGNSKTIGWSTKPRAKSAGHGKSWSNAKSAGSGKTWSVSKGTPADQRRIRIPVVGGGKPMRRKRPLFRANASGCGCLLPIMALAILLVISAFSMLF